MIKEKQIARHSLVHIFRDKTGIFLNDYLSRGKRSVLIVKLYPSPLKLFLIIPKAEFRRQRTARYTVIAKPFCIMAFKSFINGKTNKSGAVPVKPPWIWSLSDLFIDQTKYPDAKNM